MITDFPTPDSPVQRVCFLISIKDSKMKEYLVVSIVGTKREKKVVSFSYWNSYSLVSQGMKFLHVTGSTKKSKIVSDLGIRRF